MVFAIGIDGGFAILCLLFEMVVAPSVVFGYSMTSLVLCVPFCIFLYLKDDINSFEKLLSEHQK